jgi:hypothetical protein
VLVLVAVGWLPFLLLLLLLFCDALLPHLQCSCCVHALQ